VAELGLGSDLGRWRPEGTAGLPPAAADGEGSVVCARRRRQPETTAWQQARPAAVGAPRPWGTASGDFFSSARDGREMRRSGAFRRTREDLCYK
jgi:hypothetical protein